MTNEAVMEAAERIAALGDSVPLDGRDPVNQPMINNWLEAIGDDNPVYVDEEFAKASIHGGLVAPPAMVQVWTMRGLHGSRADDDPLSQSMVALDEAGYTSVVATNSEQLYHRYLRVGEQVSASSRLEKISGPKRTGLGEGYFVTTRTKWLVGEEVVAEMVWSVLKFKPPVQEKAETPQSTTGARIIDAPGYAAGVMRPVISRDTEFFWEGAKVGELRIQRFGDVLRHPPGPMDPGGDLTLKPDYVVASGEGTVFSFVVHHHPKVPGKKLPFVIALVELPEGVRVLGELIDVDPADVHIGLAVRAAFIRIDDELTMPAWEMAK